MLVEVFSFCLFFPNNDQKTLRCLHASCRHRGFGEMMVLNVWDQLDWSGKGGGCSIELELELGLGLGLGLGLQWNSTQFQINPNSM